MHTNHHVTLGDGFGATEALQEPIKYFVDRTIPHHFWGNLALSPQGGKETPPFEILA